MRIHMKYQVSFSLLFVLFFSSQNLFAQSKISHLEHEELGNVRWNRDYNTALQLAKKENKNVLILFQEVPGCATCRNYGHNVLTHPLMVEAIETLFIPLTIFNNKGGKDKKILNHYKEPTWNNPVVRIINSSEENLVPRISGDYSAITLCQKMKAVLSKSRTPIPEYLNLLESELLAAQSNLEEKYFQVSCFWTGEKELVKIDGVLHTESGFMNNREVVKVHFDPQIVSNDELNEYGKQHKFKSVEKNSKYKIAKGDVHYYLQQSIYKHIPLTELQKTKINSALGNRENPSIFLSPTQLSWLNKFQQIGGGASFLFMPIEKAWQQLKRSNR